CRAREETEREEKEQALTRTARLQRRIGWGLTGFAVVVVAGLAFGWWQHLANVALQGSLSERQAQLNEQSQANRRLQTNLDARQQALDEAHANLLADLAAIERTEGNWDSALRYAVHGARFGLKLDQHSERVSAP